MFSLSVAAADGFGGAIKVLSAVDVAALGGTITELFQVVVAEFGCATTVLSHAILAAVRLRGAIIEFSCVSCQISLQYFTIFLATVWFLRKHICSCNTFYPLSAQRKSSAQSRRNLGILYH